MSAPLPPGEGGALPPPGDGPEDGLPPRDAREAARADAASATALFIRRPILALVLNAMIIIAGLAAAFGVEVRELPEVDRPVITVTTYFTSAAPETVDREVTSIIEGAAGRVPGVASISSSSRYGRSQVTLEFSEATDLDIAASDTRDAIARVRGQLPDDVEEPRIVKADADADAFMRLAVSSASRSVEELTRLIEDEVEDRLVSVPGVADVSQWGDRSQVFRVDLDLMALASRNLTLADVADALADVAFDSPAGSINTARQSLVVRTTAAVTTPAAFEAILLKGDVRLGDVARVSLGPDVAASQLSVDGRTAIGLGLLRQSGANTLESAEAVRQAVDELNAVLPDDVRIVVTSDSANFIKGAIHEVEIALGLTVVLVIGIIWLFLRDLRATMIPALAMPVALIGTVAAIYLMGYSINIMTLLAIVLATGLVVDDAIVVLENIVRLRHQGMGPRAAAVLGTKQVFFAVVATTTTLAAVFVPLSFLPGQTGGLFREFGFTLAISVVLSAVTALTLCPMLASRLASPAEEQGAMGRLGGWLQRGYEASLRVALAAPLVVVAGFALFALAAWVVAERIPHRLTPPEDRASAILWVSAPQGVSLDYTAARMAEIEDRLLPLREKGELDHSFAIAGQGGQANRGMMILTLSDWGERARSQQQIVEEISELAAGVLGVNVFTGQSNSLGIRGAGQGLRFAVLGPSYAGLATGAQALVDRMGEDARFGSVRLSYETTQPQLFISVDRDRASDLGIRIDGLGDALKAVLDGRAVGTVFIGEQSFDIKMVSTREPVDDPGDLERIFVRTGAGDMVPLSTFVTLEERAIAPTLNRQDRLRSVEITASLAPGEPLGAAWAEAQALAAEVLPAGMRVVPLAEAATLGESSAGLLATFGFAILVVFLVLAAQFESFVSAVIVMATVPLGLACAMFAILLTGGSLNVYSQIGLVLLVGIMAKNGILIVEFANQLRDEGATVREAIERACAIRLRPVMMTTIATILGGVPLVLAAGAGAEARAALGWIIVGGLGLALISTLYLTPVAYLLLAGLSKPRAAEAARVERELLDAA